MTCLGREYELNALGLPVAIRSQSAAVSAAPARLPFENLLAFRPTRVVVTYELRDFDDAREVVDPLQ